MEKKEPTTKTQQIQEPDSFVDVMNILPKNALEVDTFFAWFTVIRVWASVIFCYYVLYYSPWYLLPLVWIVTGTAATGLFVIGHDCAHQSFSGSALINEIVGTICMMPILFPYNAWDMTHSHHHTHANNLSKDKLWKPLTSEEVAKMNKLMKLVNYYMYGPLFFESSIFHHAYHFLIPFVSSRKRMEVTRSIVFALIGGYISIRIALELGSFFKFWVAPFLVFQFWLSTFTYFHHRLPPGFSPTNPNPVGWKKETDWSKLYGGLYATVHVDFPAWVEFMCLDINWHLPHHVSSRIPWYRLRECTYALLKAYGDKMHTAQFGWKLWRETTTTTHLYDEQLGYAPMPWDEK